MVKAFIQTQTGLYTVYVLVPNELYINQVRAKFPQSGQGFGENGQDQM